jgi:hypothetical protein
MSRDVTLAVGEFGREAFDRFTELRTGSAESAMTTAALYYLADRDSGRAGWPVPSFGADGDRDASTMNVTLDDVTWAALVEEAERQGVTPETLGVHALLYFLADFDSGRVADRLGDELEEPG